LLSRFSSFIRLVHIRAYCLRWLHGAKLARRSSLSKTELDNCSRRRLNIVQKHDFPEEYFVFSKGDSVSRRSPFSALRLFLLTDELIVIGDRLALSRIDYAEKHPVVLVRDSHLSSLLYVQCAKAKGVTAQDGSAAKFKRLSLSDHQE